MERAEILSTVQDIVRTVLDDDTVHLHDRATSDDVLGWDSLANVRIVFAVEAHFKIRFDIQELNSFSDVGALVDCIGRKLSVTAVPSR
jgi:acyl carrier protein